jgi:L-ribulose-5-phosphate 3-epimerase
MEEMMSLPFVTGYAEQFYLIAEEGLIQACKDQADYWYIDGSLPSEYPDQWDAARIKTLKQQIDQSTAKPIFHGNFKLPLSSDVEEVRRISVKKVYEEIDLSAALSATLIIHGGSIVEPRLVTKAKQTGLENYLKSIDEIASYALSKGVVVLLENLSNYLNYRPFHYIFTTPAEYEYVFSQIEYENVFFFFDLGHGAICEGDPVSVIERFHKKIWGMSLSNNNGVQDQHLGLNQGILNYSDIIRSIIAKNWKGIIAFETRGKTLNQSIEELTNIYTQCLDTFLPVSAIAGV